MIALLFNVRTYAAIRARLTALVVLVLLATGLFQGHARPADAHTGSDRLLGTTLHACQRAAPPTENFGRKRNGVRGEAATRRGVAHGRPHDSTFAKRTAEEADAGSGERAVPPRPRRTSRQRQAARSDRDEDGDPEPSPFGFHTRAPPASGLQARAS